MATTAKNYTKGLGIRKPIRMIILHSERRNMKTLLFDLVQLLNQMLNSGILNAVLSSLFRKWLLVLGGM